KGGEGRGVAVRERRVVREIGFRGRAAVSRKRCAVVIGQNGNVEPNIEGAARLGALERAGEPATGELDRRAHFAGAISAAVAGGEIVRQTAIMPVGRELEV